MSKIEGNRCGFSNQPSSSHQQAHLPQTKDRVQATRIVSPWTPLNPEILPGDWVPRDLRHGFECR